MQPDPNTSEDRHREHIRRPALTPLEAYGLERQLKLARYERQAEARMASPVPHIAHAAHREYHRLRTLSRELRAGMGTPARCHVPGCGRDAEVIWRDAHWCARHAADALESVRGGR